MINKTLEPPKFIFKRIFANFNEDDPSYQDEEIEKEEEVYPVNDNTIQNILISIKLSLEILQLSSTNIVG